MTINEIQQHLQAVLVDDAPMSRVLYDEALAEYLDEFGQSLKTDQEDYLFAVIEYSGEVAMILLHKSGEAYINDVARTKLQELWGGTYRSNMDELIPVFAKQLDAGEIAIVGVETV